MAKIITGTLTLSGAAYNLDLAFKPSRITIYNSTIMKTPANGKIAQSIWFDDMADGYAYQWVFDATPVLITQEITSNGFTPYTTADGSLFTNTLKTVTAITKASNASITSTAHGLSVDDIVTFSGVVGMTEINYKRGKITSVADANTFAVDIDSSSFTTYTSGGYANYISGTQYNSGSTGITLGTGVIGDSSDVLYYEAVLEDAIL